MIDLKSYNFCKKIKNRYKISNNILKMCTSYKYDIFYTQTIINEIINKTPNKGKDFYALKLYEYFKQNYENLVDECVHLFQKKYSFLSLDEAFYIVYLRIIYDAINGELSEILIKNYIKNSGNFWINHDDENLLDVNYATDFVVFQDSKKICYGQVKVNTFLYSKDKNMKKDFIKKEELTDEKFGYYPHFYFIYSVEKLEKEGKFCFYINPKTKK